MPTDVLMIGLDAVEPTLTDSWADAGLLPTFDWLRRSGTTVQIGSPIPGIGAAVWPEVNYGLGVSRTGLYETLIPLYFPSEGVSRKMRQDEIRGDSLFWIEASRAGKRVAAVDQLYSAPDPMSDALQLVDWGVHDRPFPSISSPMELLADTDRKYGRYPVSDCDALHGGTARGLGRLAGLLEQGAEAKAGLVTDLLRKSSWDLMTCTFTEGHCAGHQMWHLMAADAGLSRNGPGASGPADGMLRTYRALDAALGRVIEAAGPDALVAVICNKGMGPTLGGPQLMTEFLHHLGLGASRRLRRRLWDQVPGRAKSAMLKAIPVGVRDPVRRRAAIGAEPGFSDGARAMFMRNDQDAAIRLNIRGRDVNGVVGPGAESERLLGEIRTELLSLRHPEQPDQAIVERVVIADEVWSSDRAETIPDLLVEFRKDIGVIDGCESNRVGRIHIPVSGIRSGNHTSNHRGWVVGPGVTAGVKTTARTVDIAPTLLSRIGAPIPNGLDGEAIPALGGLAS